MIFYIFKKRLIKYLLVETTAKIKIEGVIDEGFHLTNVRYEFNPDYYHNLYFTSILEDERTIKDIEKELKELENENTNN